LLLGRAGAPFDGADAARQRVYRDLVQSNLSGALRRACPHAIRLGGAAPFDDLVARFLDEQPPTTRLLRAVPGEFTAWLATLPAGDLPHPSFAELCHFEALEIDVTLAETAHDLGVVAGNVVDAEAVVVVDPSARLAAYAHPVHRVTAQTTAWPAATTTPSIVLCFQRAEAFAVDVISPAVARVLVRSTDGAALGAILDELAAEAAASGAVFERGRVRADLVDLHRRGALVGFRRA
jgi:hypothetical protein